MSSKAEIKGEVVTEKFRGPLVNPERGTLISRRQEHLCKGNDNLLAEHQKVMLIQLVSLITLALDIGVGARLDSIREVYLIVSHKGKPCAIPLALFTLILATCKPEVGGDIIKDLGKLPDLDRLLDLSGWGIDEDPTLARVCVDVEKHLYAGWF